MLANEFEGRVDGRRQRKANLHPVDDDAFVAPVEPPRLDPGIGKMAFAVLAEQQDAADRRDCSPLMACHKTKRLEIVPAQAAGRCERLGSSSEVQRFRVEIRHRLLVVGLAARAAAQFID